jgi:hypothetical protein
MSNFNFSDPDYLQNVIETLQMKVAALEVKVATPSASDNKTKTEICGNIIESSSICEYCKVRDTGQTLDCSICVCTSYGNFVGRKLSVIC